MIQTPYIPNENPLQRLEELRRNNYATQVADSNSNNNFLAAPVIVHTPAKTNLHTKTLNPSGTINRKVQLPNTTNKSPSKFTPRAAFNHSNSNNTNNKSLDSFHSPSNSLTKEEDDVTNGGGEQLILPILQVDEDDWAHEYRQKLGQLLLERGTMSSKIIQEDPLSSSTMRSSIDPSYADIRRLTGDDEGNQLDINNKVIIRVYCLCY